MYQTVRPGRDPRCALWWRGARASNLLEVAPPILLVDDDEVLAASIERMIRPFCEVRLVTTVAAGRAQIDRAPVLAALIDESLPDGSGLDLVAYLRRRRPAVPVMLFTALRDRRLANRAQALRAEFVFKPAGPSNIIPFVSDAVGAAGEAQAKLELAVGQVVQLCELSSREVDVIHLALAGIPRTVMARELEITENTLKSTIRRLLEKAGEETLEELVRSVFDAALRGARVQVR